jgi:hypothetical protein
MKVNHHQEKVVLQVEEVGVQEVEVVEEEDHLVVDHLVEEVAHLGELVVLFVVLVLEVEEEEVDKQLLRLGYVTMAQDRRRQARSVCMIIIPCRFIPPTK